MVGQQQARNSSQKVPQQSAKGTCTTAGSTPAVIYTVPAGQKAYVSVANWNNVANGGNSFLQSRYAGVLARKATVAEASPIADPAGIVVLNAGETIAFIGDSGANNGTINYFFTYQESPA